MYKLQISFSTWESYKLRHILVYVSFPVKLARVGVRHLQRYAGSDQRRGADCSLLFPTPPPVRSRRELKTGHEGSLYTTEKNKPEPFVFAELMDQQYHRLFPRKMPIDSHRTFRFILVSILLQ